MWNPFNRTKTLEAPKHSDNLLYQALYVRHECPDCAGNTFTMGPQGGMCQNVKCGNDECGSEFNLAPFEDGKWLDAPFLTDRINRSEEESKAIYGRGYGPKHPEVASV